MSQPAIDINKLSSRVAGLSCLRFFPTRDDTEGRLEITKEIASMAGTWERALWIIDQLKKLTNDWPGCMEMRGIFCHRFLPADGISAESKLCPDGQIPRDQAIGFIPANKQEQLRDPRDRSLPSGDVGNAVRALIAPRKRGDEIK